MRVFKIRQILHIRGLLLLEHGTGYRVTNEGSAKYLIEHLFDDLDAVETWVAELPNRMTDEEGRVFDAEFEEFVSRHEQREERRTIENQCDGCRRGLPLEDGIHKGDGDGYDMIACTAHRYLRQAEDRSCRVGHKETPVHYLHAHQIIGDWPKWDKIASIVWPKGCGK